MRKMAKKKCVSNAAAGGCQVASASARARAKGCGERGSQACQGLTHIHTHTRHRPLLRLPLLPELPVLHPETAQNISPAIVCQEQVLDEGVAGLAAKGNCI